MDDEGRFRQVNSRVFVNMVDPPSEVTERETQKAIDLLRSKSLIGFYAMIIQRPDEIMPERIVANTMFVPIGIDSHALLELAAGGISDIHHEGEL